MDTGNLKILYPCPMKNSTLNYGRNLLLRIRRKWTYYHSITNNKEELCLNAEDVRKIIALISSYKLDQLMNR
jgi:hypothetical protein